MPRFHTLMFQSPMSSPMMTRMLGFFSCACTSERLPTMSVNARAAALRTRMQRCSTEDCGICSLLACGGYVRPSLDALAGGLATMIADGRHTEPCPAAGENGPSVTLHVDGWAAFGQGLRAGRSMRCGRKISHTRIGGNISLRHGDVPLDQ